MKRSDNMCHFCEELKYNHTESNISVASQERKFVPGHWAVLMQGVDSNNRPYLFADGDDESDNFYPRFCPVCGKNLDAIYPAPEGEGKYAHRDYCESKQWVYD